MKKGKLVTMVTIGVIVVIAIILICNSFTCVPAGHVGIVTEFGKVDDRVLDEGCSIIAFWKKVTPMSMRTQEIKENASIPTKEGLTVNLDCSLLFSLNKDSARKIFQTVGLEYPTIIVEPQFRSLLRDMSVNYEAKDLYTANRQLMENKLIGAVKEMVEARGLTFDKVLLRAIVLPPLLSTAITQKMEQEQKVAQMQFILQKEKLEAERKTVEAQGVANAQKIIDGTLTDNYIRYLWVKALEIAAASPSTTIYVPVGQDGLPLMKEINKGK